MLGVLGLVIFLEWIGGRGGLYGWSVMRFSLEGEYRLKNVIYFFNLFVLIVLEVNISRFGKNVFVCLFWF